MRQFAEEKKYTEEEIRQIQEKKRKIEEETQRRERETIDIIERLVPGFKFDANGTFYKLTKEKEAIIKWAREALENNPDESLGSVEEVLNSIRRLFDKYIKSAELKANEERETMIDAECEVVGMPYGDPDYVVPDPRGNAPKGR